MKKTKKILGILLALGLVIQSAAFNSVASASGSGVSVPMIYRVAGSENKGTSGDGGLAVDAEVYYPSELATDKAGNVYFTQTGDSLRKVDTNGIINTIRNDSNPVSFPNNDDTGNSIYFYPLMGIDIDGNQYYGEYYWSSETGKYSAIVRIYRVDKDEKITLIAGTGVAGLTGDDGPAAQAKIEAIELNSNFSLRFDKAGNIYFLESNSSYLSAYATRIRKIDTNGVISTYAGTGTLSCSGDGGPATQADICVTDYTFDGLGNCYILSDNNYSPVIRKIDKYGTISTPYSKTSNPDWGYFWSYKVLAADESGNLYSVGDATDKDNENNLICRLYKIDTVGKLTTVIGNAAGVSGDGGKAVDAQILNYRLAIDNCNGKLYLFGLSNYIRVVTNLITPSTFDYISPLSKGKIASSSDCSIQINNSAQEMSVFSIDGSNYFKLRDLATVLTGTGKQFDVGWDSANNAITLTSNKAYTSIGGELAVSGSTGEAAAALSTAAVYLDGAKVSMTAYTINGSNYFKLRDIASALDFGVTYNSATGTIGIDTSTGYTA